MQAAIDRVIRSFTFRNPVSLGEPMSDSPSIQGSDEATEFATRLLENYKGQLARRSPKTGWPASSAPIGRPGWSPSWPAPACTRSTRRCGISGCR